MEAAKGKGGSPIARMQFVVAFNHLNFSITFCPIFLETFNYFLSIFSWNFQFYCYSQGKDGPDWFNACIALEKFRNYPLSMFFCAKHRTFTLIPYKLSVGIYFGLWNINGPSTHTYL